MSRFKLKKRSKGPGHPVEINVTPMIDMMSVLVSFLLMTAVFSSTGNHRIEVPFLSSKQPPTQQELDKKPERVVTVTIIDKDNLRLEMGFSNNDQKQTKDELQINPQGLDALQQKLYDARIADPAFDKVTVMTEATVTYETMIAVIDAMRNLDPKRQPVAPTADFKKISGVDENALIQKVVLGNVIF